MEGTTRPGYDCRVGRPAYSLLRSYRRSLERFRDKGTEVSYLHISRDFPDINRTQMSYGPPLHRKTALCLNIANVSSSIFRIALLKMEITYLRSVNGFIQSGCCCRFPDLRRNCGVYRRPDTRVYIPAFPAVAEQGGLPKGEQLGSVIMMKQEGE